jgi:hypothetical protein
VSSAQPADVRPAPDLITAVIGFRQWRLYDGTLWSMYANTPWPGGCAIATCLTSDFAAERDWRPCESAPAKRCRCGIYAWYRPCPRLGSAATADLVAGAVALWGRLELHATGIRSEYGAAVALALPLSRGAKRRRIEALAADLGIDAVPARHLRSAALAHGELVPDTLKPTAGRPTCGVGGGLRA